MFITCVYLWFDEFPIQIITVIELSITNYFNNKHESFLADTEMDLKIFIPYEKH